MSEKRVDVVEKGEHMQGTKNKAKSNCHSPVHQQTTNSVVPLIDGYGVTSLVELICSSETGRTRTDNSNRLASSVRRRSWFHPTHFESLVNDGTLDRLDTNGSFINTENTSRLARSRADSSGEFGEIVGLEQSVESILPSLLENHGVPLGDDIGNRTTSVGLTEWNTAVHASSGLVSELIGSESARDFLPVLDPLSGRSVSFVESLVLHETTSLVELGKTFFGGVLVHHGVFDIDNFGLGMLALGRASRSDELGSGDSKRVHVSGESRVEPSGNEVDLGSGLRGDEIDDGLSLLLLKYTCRFLLQDPLVVQGHNSDKHREQVVEVAQDSVGNLGTSVVSVVLDERTQLGDLLWVLDGTELDGTLVDLGAERMGHVEDIGDTTRHTSSKVSTGKTKDDNSSTSHVLTTVITGTFNNEVSTRVSDGESLGSDTSDETLTRSRTKEADISDDDVLFRLEGGSLGRVDDESTTGKTLTDVIVGVTLEFDGNTRGEEGTHGLTCRSLHVDVDGVSGKTSFSVFLGDMVREGGTQSSVSVDDIAVNLDGKTLGDSRLGLVDELVVKSDVELVVLRSHSVGGNVGSHQVSRLEDRSQVEMSGLGSSERLVDMEEIGTTNHFVDGSETKLGHDTSEFLNNIVEEIDDLFGLTSEFGSQSRVLSGNTDRASVLVTSLHHDTTHGDQWSGGETPLFSTEQGSNGDISTGSDLTISLDSDSTTQIVEHQGLMGLSKTKLPRETGVLDRGPLGSTSATVMTGNDNVVRLGLGNTGSNDTDTDFGDELSTLR